MGLKGKGGPEGQGDLGPMERRGKALQVGKTKAKTSSSSPCPAPNVNQRTFVILRVIVKKTKSLRGLDYTLNLMSD